MTCREAVRENGKVAELLCTIDTATRGADAPGRKVKSTLHWVSASHAVDAEVRFYENLFTVKDPAGNKDRDFKEFLSPGSLKVVKGCKVEPAVRNLLPYDRFQFERLGYFCVDPDTTGQNIVLNRTVKLRDAWAKTQSRKE
jgi:glutaminyl-tRNA synthetase